MVFIVLLSSDCIMYYASVVYRAKYLTSLCIKPLVALQQNPLSYNIIIMIIIIAFLLYIYYYLFVIYAGFIIQPIDSVHLSISFFHSVS